MRISDWSSDVCSSDLDADVSDCPGGHIVEQDRQSAVLGQICKMPEYAFLIGFVVIRSDDQRRVSPSGLRRLHMLKRGHGVVRSAPGDYRDTSRSLLDADFRSEEHTSELHSLLRISYAVFCLKKKHVSLATPITTNNHNSL